MSETDQLTAPPGPSLPAWAGRGAGWDRLGFQGPRAHQEADVPALAALLEGEDSRTQYLAACGTGKTLTGIWTAQALGADRVIVGFPSLALIDQTMRLWAAAGDAATPLEMMALSSPVAGDLRLQDCFRPASTSVRDVEAFWSAPLPQGTRRVLFVCYPSVGRLTEMYVANPDAPVADLLLCDEAHHVAGDVTKEAGALLDEDRIPAHRRLFMTATPIFTPIDRDPVEGTVARVAPRFIGMDQGQYFGAATVRRGFRWAIEQGILTDYTVVTPEPLPARLQSTVRDLEAGEARQDPKRRMPYGYWTKAFMLALEIGQAPNGARRVFTFHQKVRHARRFAAAVRLAARAMGLPRPYAAALDGSDSVARRAERLGALKRAEGGLVASVNVLTEGVDAPTVDGIALIDAKQSVVAIAQAIGRTIRLDPDRPAKNARVLVPIVTGRGAEALAAEGHQALLNVLVALGESDERLRAYAQSVRRAAGTTLDLPEPEAGDFLSARMALGHQVGLPPAERSRLMSTLAHHVVDEFAHTFEEYYTACEAWLARPGNLFMNARPGTTESGLDIGVFLSQQRRRLREEEGRATGRRRGADERRTALEALPGWTLDVDEAQWIATAVALSAWMSAHDQRMPDPTATDGVERELGVWAKNQKAGQQAVEGVNKKRQPLPEHRRRRLLEICPHFVFSLTPAARAQAAQEKFRAQQLRDAVADHMNMPPDAERSPEMLALLAEAARREREQKARPPRRRAEAAAPPPSPEALAQWEREYERVRRFVLRERRAPSHEARGTEERDLGVWLRRERMRVSAANLTPPMPLAQRTKLLILIQDIVQCEPPAAAPRKL